MPVYKAGNAFLALRIPFCALSPSAQGRRLVPVLLHQFQQPVQPAFIDGDHGLFAHFRLGVVSH